MKVKIFHPNAHGKIEFTRVELEKLLNEIYEEGKRDCEKNHPYTWTSPSICNTPYYSGSITGTTSGSVINGTLNIDNKSTSIDGLTCKCNCDTADNNSAQTQPDCNCTASASKAETTSTEKENNPFTYTIELGTIDTDTLNKTINSLVNSARNSFLNQATRKDNDPYAKLAQELNF